MKVYKLFSIVLVLFLFVSCGETTSDDLKNTDVVDNSDNSLASLNPYFSQQWYLKKDNLFYSQHSYIDDDAHIHSEDFLDRYNAQGIKIAIIDDGLDVNHEDLYLAVTNSYGSDSKTSDVSPTSINDYHGTAVTGVIGARSNNIGIKGIASGSSIIFLKYKEYMSDSETIELFNKAEEFGADIISCSWGTYDVSNAVKDKIIDLSRNGRDGKGTLIVFAVGNDDYYLDNYNDESGIPEVISVGATDEENLRALYSNYGSALDIMAPGGYYCSIITLDVSGNNGENIGNYIDCNGNFIGTSASAPIVSGVLGLLLEKYNNTLTLNEVMDLLKTKSDKIGNPSYDENGWNQYYGYGKINLSELLK